MSNGRRARQVRRLATRKAVAGSVKPELVEKDVYGAEAYVERAERRYFEREGDEYTPYVVPVVNSAGMGFRPNEER